MFARLLCNQTTDSRHTHTLIAVSLISCSRILEENNPLYFEQYFYLSKQQHVFVIHICFNPEFNKTLYFLLQLIEKRTVINFFISSVIDVCIEFSILREYKPRNLFMRIVDSAFSVI